MEGIAFIVFILLMVVLTPKLWSKYLQDKSEDIEIWAKDRSAERQNALKDLDLKIDRIIKANGGKLYSIDEISAKLNPKSNKESTNDQPN